MKRIFLAVIVFIQFITLYCAFSTADDLIKKFARPGPQPKLYYSGALVGKTYYVAGTGDGAQKNPDENYYVKVI